MFILKAAQAPIPMDVPELNKKLIVPKFQMDEVIEWAAQVQQGWLELKLGGMTEEQKRQWLEYNPPLPPTIADIKMMARTPDGARHIARHCFANAKVLDLRTKAALPPLTAEEVEQIILANGTGSIAAVAWYLIDCDEESLKQKSSDKGEDGQDPTKGQSKPGMRNTSTTGPKTLPSSLQPTQASTGGN